MYKIGVRAHDVGKLSAKLLFDEVTSFGFDGVQLVFPKAFGQMIDEVDIPTTKEVFNDSIMLLGAYFNMIHPDQLEVIKGSANFKKHLKAAKLLNVSYVGTETGSLMGSPWGYMPENHSDASFNQVVSVTKDLLVTAKEVGTKILIEGAWNHTIYSPQRLKELMDVLDSSHVDVIIDLYNFLNITNHNNHVELFEVSLELLKDKIKVIHLKDYIIEDNKLKQVGLGQGLMNYEAIFDILNKYDIEPYLVFEGVAREDLASSLKFIKDIIKKKRRI